MGFKSYNNNNENESSRGRKFHNSCIHCIVGQDRDALPFCVVFKQNFLFKKIPRERVAVTI